VAEKGIDSLKQLRGSLLLAWYFFYDLILAAEKGIDSLKQLRGSLLLAWYFFYDLILAAEKGIDSLKQLRGSLLLAWYFFYDLILAAEKGIDSLKQLRGSPLPPRCFFYDLILIAGEGKGEGKSNSYNNIAQINPLCQNHANFAQAQESNMLKKILLTLSTLLCCSTTFANLPYSPIQFPRDEAAHTDNVPYPVTNLSEWWYYNGKLTTTDGRNFGYYISYNYFQWNFKGTKILTPLFQIQITDIDKQQVYGSSILLPAKDVSFSTQALQIRMSKDMTLSMDHNTYVLDATVQSKQNVPLHLSFRLTPARDALLINGNGMNDMWDGTNTYYYSQTHLLTEGTLSIGNENFTIDTQHSLSWMDHQWGDFFVVPKVNQWTWASVQLENGVEINLDTIIDPKTKELISTASIIMPDNSRVYTHNLTITPKIDARYKHPLYYVISIPEIHLEMAVNSLVPDQDVNGISEAVSAVDATLNGVAVKGYAYAESTVVLDAGSTKK
jgi:predicted secreted hydrolase